MGSAGSTEEGTKERKSRLSTILPRRSKINNDLSSSIHLGSSFIGKKGKKPSAKKVQKKEAETVELADSSSRALPQRSGSIGRSTPLAPSTITSVSHSQPSRPTSADSSQSSQTTVSRETIKRVSTKSISTHPQTSESVTYMPIHGPNSAPAPKQSDDHLTRYPSSTTNKSLSGSSTGRPTESVRHSRSSSIIQASHIRDSPPSKHSSGLEKVITNKSISGGSSHTQHTSKENVSHSRRSRAASGASATNENRRISEPETAQPVGIYRTTSRSTRNSASRSSVTHRSESGSTPREEEIRSKLRRERESQRNNAGDDDEFVLLDDGQNRQKRREDERRNGPTGPQGYIAMTSTANNGKGDADRALRPALREAAYSARTPPVESEPTASADHRSYHSSRGDGSSLLSTSERETDYFSPSNNNRSGFVDGITHEPNKTANWEASIHERTQLFLILLIGYMKEYLFACKRIKYIMLRRLHLRRRRADRTSERATSNVRAMHMNNMNVSDTTVYAHYDEMIRMAREIQTLQTATLDQQREILGITKSINEHLEHSIRIRLYEEEQVENKLRHLRAELHDYAASRLRSGGADIIVFFSPMSQKCQGIVELVSIHQSSIELGLSDYDTNENDIQDAIALVCHSEGQDEISQGEYHSNGINDRTEYINSLIDLISDEITDLEEEIDEMNDNIALVDSGKPGLIDLIYNSELGSSEAIVRELPGQEQIFRSSEEIEDKLWEVGDKWKRIDDFKQELDKIAEECVHTNEQTDEPCQIIRS
ncbi:hypothetical protein PNOK_0647400 [Pyrrhoderma noxium]|uniref:Uncharacterized protein n=1 Tax=Pyrrhoderma noxium TaxID=2282107 RepID=A0A286UEL0_9AGAM|nr:hypothetical protein PNOK_0647400 [Pyrrhoderma noxium]